MCGTARQFFVMSLQDRGYSLDQLLKWCEEDCLISGFDKTDEAVIIFLDGGSRRLTHAEATALLKGMFTSTQRGSKQNKVRA